MAPLGIVNVHASLLPRWRGAAPFSVRFSLVMRLLAFPLCVLGMALIPALIVPGFHVGCR